MSENAYLTSSLVAKGTHKYSERTVAELSHVERIGKCIRSSDKRIMYIDAGFCSWMGVDISRVMAAKYIEKFTSPISRHFSQLHHVERQVFSDRRERICVFSMISPFHCHRILTSLRIFPFTTQDGSTDCCWVWQQYHLANLYAIYVPKYKLNKHELVWSSPFDIFSAKEWAFIWPLLYGYRKDVIANSFGVTRKHLGRVVSRALDKTDCTDVEHLTAKLLALGFDKVVPAEIFLIIKS